MFINKLYILIMALITIQSVMGDSYFTQYRQCLVDSCPQAAAVRCERFASTQGRNFASLTTSLAGLNLSIPCQNGNEILYGNGIKVDSISCGARPASEECDDRAFVSSTTGVIAPYVQGNACQNLSTSTIASDQADSLRHWDTNCVQIQVGTPTGGAQSGCASCGARPSIVQDVAQKFKNGINDLLTCFSPRGAYPHTRLYSALIQKMTDLQASGGITLTCPNDDLARQRNTGHHPSASADSSTSTISVFHRTMSGTRSASTMAHEFMHLLKDSAHPIDNEDSHTHNHPHHHHAHQNTDATADYTPTTPNPGGASNEMMDRVYSCQKLCFDEEMISKEQCQLCLSYRTNPLPRSLAKKCNALISREDLVIMENQFIVSDTDISDMCNTQYDNMAADFQQRNVSRSVRQERNGSVSFGDNENRDAFGIYMRANEDGSAFISHWGSEPAFGVESDLANGREHPRNLIDDSIKAEIPRAYTPRPISIRSNPTFGEIKNRCEQAYNGANQIINEMLTKYPRDSRNRSKLLARQLNYNFGAKNFAMKRMCNKIKLFAVWQAKCVQIKTTGGYTVRDSATGLCSKLNEHSNGEIFRNVLRPQLADLKEKALSWNCLQQHTSSNSAYSAVAIPEALTFAGSQTPNCDGAEIGEGEITNFTQREATAFCNQQFP